LYEPIDLAALALELGASYVARSFSGDKSQLIPLIKGAIAHPGFALIDVMSPCVTFNNHVGSTKSYDYVREHLEATSVIDFVPMHQEITTSYEEGTRQVVTLHDGSVIHLKKLASDWDLKDRDSALTALRKAQAAGDILTGLLYMDLESEELHEMLKTSHQPLNRLSEKDLCPGSAILSKINDSFR
jgi:2-oxoglutarate ferredoxin oxidoreductase subunit beta